MKTRDFQENVETVENVENKYWSLKKGSIHQQEREIQKEKMSTKSVEISTVQRSGKVKQTVDNVDN